VDRLDHDAHATLSEHPFYLVLAGENVSDELMHEST